MGHKAETFWSSKKVDDTKEGDGALKEKNTAGGRIFSVVMESNMTEKEVVVEYVLEVKKARMGKKLRITRVWKFILIFLIF